MRVKLAFRIAGRIVLVFGALEELTVVVPSDREVLGLCFGLSPLYAKFFPHHMQAMYMYQELCFNNIVFQKDVPSLS